MLPLITDAVVAVVAAVLAIPCGVFWLECIVAIFARRLPAKSPADHPQPKAVILVPAHDEEVVIAETLAGLKQQLGPADRILVVADNCSDGTVDLVKAAGVEVIERHDTERRGKGYAIVYGLDHLAADPPDIVTIVDADCTAEAGALELIAREASFTGRPVQAEYLLTSPDDSPKTVVSALAFLVRNRVRPRGLARVGLPAHLTGSGMAFPWDVLRNAPATGSYLVEDLLMGIELALKGTPPLLCAEAQITSLLPTRDRAAMGQRRRWEHGQLMTLTRYAPRLVWAGVTRYDFGLFALGMDLFVPPLALLVLACVGVLTLSVVPLVLFGRWWSFVVAADNLFTVATGVGVAWLFYGRSTIRLSQLIAVPLYVLWKIPLYLSLLLRGGQKTWERTERTSK
ncbi:MAG: glycosyltransferase family 2 protein [Deltaproteobacteria bacterium]